MELIDKKVKIVYSDKNESKVVRGVLKKEDNFTYTIETFDKNIVIIGKMFTIKLGNIEREDN